jgi:16S rRNA (guanine527-N7)-methyltransferase
MLLVDSVGKKVKATEHFCRELGLDGIGSVQARTETLAEESPLQSAFDIVTARAVAYLPEVLPWCAPFVKKGGTIALYKLDNPDEVRDGGTIAKRLGLRLASKYPYELGGQKRAILMYEKM